jgi:hypothetical protein
MEEIAKIKHQDIENAKNEESIRASQESQSLAKKNLTMQEEAHRSSQALQKAQEERLVGEEKQKGLQREQHSERLRREGYEQQASRTEPIQGRGMSDDIFAAIQATTPENEAATRAGLIREAGRERGININVGSAERRQESHENAAANISKNALDVSMARTTATNKSHEGIAADKNKTELLKEEIKKGNKEKAIIYVVPGGGYREIDESDNAAKVAAAREGLVTFKKFESMSPVDKKIWESMNKKKRGESTAPPVTYLPPEKFSPSEGTTAPGQTYEYNRATGKLETKKK